MTSLWTDRSRISIPDTELPEKVDVLVVGAGLTGLATACILANGGKRVAVIDARGVGAVTTGHTTAKISLLQGTKLSSIRKQHAPEVARRYVEVSRAGMDWLLRLCSRRDVGVQYRDAVTYAGTPDQVGSARREYELAVEAGLAVSWSDSYDAPFPVHGAAVLRDQAQCDPLELLGGLVDELTDAGGTIHEGHRLISVSLAGRPEARLDTGAVVKADHVVLATGTPVLDRGFHFARLSPMRSYLIAYAGAAPVEAMMISAGSPTRSVRDVPPSADGSRLLVGGAGHKVGRAVPTSDRLDELRAWTQEHFPGAVETTAWSAQDYSSVDQLPIAGPLPIGGARIHVATGYDKWGMTGAPAAAQRIAGVILHRSADWPQPLRASPSSLMRAIGLNLETAGLLVSGWADAELRGHEDPHAVHREGLVPTASGPDGDLIGVCTHLGGILRWNDAERSWDCPLHGSRFDCNGKVLEGPATRDLKRRA